MIEIAPGITLDSERAFGKPVVAGTRVTAAHVLALLVFGPADLRTVPKRLRVRAAAMVGRSSEPEPDGFFKRHAPAPFKPGTMIAVAQGLAIRYAIDDDGLWFYRVQVIGR